MGQTVELPCACGIAVMAKASHPGRTKTRLCPPLTGVEAASFNTAFLQDITANIVSAAANESIKGYAAFSPKGSEAFFRETLTPQTGLIEATGPALGDCLIHALKHQFELGHSAAGVLNSDSPTLPHRFLSEAACILAAPGERAVLGPSTDGGYYFLGLKTLHTRLFEDIAWSTERVAGQTLDRAREIGLEVVLLPEWYDVDDAASLRTLAGELFENRAFHTDGLSSPAPATAALFRQLLSAGDFASRTGLSRLSPERAA